MLDYIIKFSIRNKIIIVLMTIVLVIWGVWSATKLPIDAVPDITNNQVQIITVCPRLAGQEVEQLVTFPIEQSIANIPAIEEVRSISRFGLSVITVVFKDNVDIYFARQLVHQQLKDAEENIPKGIGSPKLAPVSTGLGEIYQYILHPKKGSENKYNAIELRTMQDWIVARQLYGTEGVAEVNSFGGELKQYEVAINPNRLKAMDISISDIFNALEKNNENTGGAYIDKKPNSYFIRGIGLAHSIEDIKNIAVKNNLGTIPIFIKDVADVRISSAIRYGALTYNGEREAVGGIVMMLKGANSNQVVNRIKQKLPIIQKSLPDDIIIEPFLDRTDLVDRAIHTVEKNLIEGALIVIFVLVIFLGNFRAGLIVASAIPLSLLFALGMMNVFDVSANLMSLGAIDFGLIVDGAVIIVEATLHHIGLNKSNKRLTQNEMDHEVFLSASKIRKSAAFGEIIILIVYIPILTLQGIEGKMFAPMAQTVGFAILGALILSLTYIPMMSALFLSKKISDKESFSDKLIKITQRIYNPLLYKAMRLKYWVVSATVIIFAISIVFFQNMGSEFIPQLEEGDYAFHCILPQGSSLSQSIETSMQAMRIIKEFDEVKMVVGKTGSAEVPTDPMPPEATDMIIILKPQNEWKNKISFRQLGEQILAKLEVIPGVFFEYNQPIQMRFNELMTGVRQDVAVKIFGENLDTLVNYADQVNKIIQNTKGATAPQVEQVSGLPQINVEYDRTRLANYGLNVEDINNILSTAFAGKTTGQIYENERRFDLVVRLDTNYRKSINDVNNLLVPTNTGVQVPLSQVANIKIKLGPAQISREEGKRRIVIGFNVSGRDIKSVVSDIQNQLDKKIKLPIGYYFAYGGQFENLEEASNRLMITVPIALFLIYLLLYFTFHSFKQATLIFTAIPMSAIGGIFALIIRDMPFSISAGVGFIALFGVSVLNGIVLIGTYNQLIKEKMEMYGSDFVLNIQEIINIVAEGSNIRLRPVLMTATVASLGFLPMAISTSAGAEVQKPLATVVIGGLISATFLTLFVLPQLYIIFHSKFNKKVIYTAASILLLIISTSLTAHSKIINNADEAIEIALKNNSTILAKNLEIQSKQSLRNTIIELPKLEFNAQFGNFNSNQFDNAFELKQTIPFFTIFGAKSDLINAEIKEKQLQTELTIIELKNKIRTYYYQIQYLKNNEYQLNYLDSLYNEFINIAKLRYQSGDTKKVDISTAETKRGDINLILKQNKVYLDNANQILKSLLNINDEIELPDNLIFQPLQVSTLFDSSMIANHISIKLLYQNARIAEESKNVERAANIPDLTIAYGNQSIIGNYIENNVEKFYDASKRFSYFNIGISLPITLNATSARLQSLEYIKQAAEANAYQQEKELSAQFKNELLQYEHYLQQFRYYQQTALPNANEIASTALAQYKTGDISYIEYLYSLQTITEIHLNYLKSIQQINQSVINIYSFINQ